MIDHRSPDDRSGPPERARNRRDDRASTRPGAGPGAVHPTPSGAPLGAPTGEPSRPWTTTALITVLFALPVATYVLIDRRAADALDGLAPDLWYQLVAWGTVVWFWVGTRDGRLDRATRVLLATGFALFGLGDAIYSVNTTVLGNDAFPSLADVPYVLGYPFIAAGLSTMVRQRRSVSRVPLLDAGVVIAPLTVAGWLYLVEPVAGDAEVDLVARVVSALYPVGDLLCIAVLVCLFAQEGIRALRDDPVVRTLTVSMVAILVADVVYLVSTVQGEFDAAAWSDTLYLVGYLAFGAVAVVRPPANRLQGDEGHGERPAATVSRTRLVLLAAAALVTSAILLIEWASDRDLPVPLFVLGTAVSFLLVVARMGHLVHEVEQSREQLRFDATHDHLTRLPNRQLFVSLLDERVRSGTGGALVFVDLDHFKDVNDTFGHQRGDEMLVEVAEVLAATVRADDVVARLAGDEFVVLLSSASGDELMLIAQRIVERLRLDCTGPRGEALLDPSGEPRRVDVTASVGLVRWHAGDPVEARHLMSRADAAMYDAKRAEGDQLVIDA
jgi:diguanylate cyclase (GGDEF)-like protein